mmetsp:Transcript_18964/g.47275  ORF Transcript_18964/g.47275 Transcript_18964/m.47275 type:complete len:179 (+) Transcript_18964:171-707(+)
MALIVSNDKNDHNNARNNYMPTTGVRINNQFIIILYSQQVRALKINSSSYSYSQQVRELLHTKLAANSDGQAEPKNKRALSLMPGLSPAPLRPQLSDEKLSFETFSVDPSAHVERNSRSSSSRHASVQLLEATGGGIGTIEEGSHRVCEDTSPAAAVGEGNSSGEGGELPWLEDPPSH